MNPNQIIENYYSIVDFAAKKFPKIITQGTVADIDDLKQEGIIALLAAYKTFNPEKGVSFPTYAQTCVYNAMVSFLRTLDPLPASVRKDLKTLEKAKQNNKTNNKYPIEQLSQITGLTVERIKKVNMWNIIQYNETDEENLQNTADQTFNLENSIIQKENINHIKQAIKEMPEREQRIFIQRIVNKKRIRQIAEEENLTPARVSQIYSKVVSQLTSIYNEN